jgi:hypothetical protein
MRSRRHSKNWTPSRNSKRLPSWRIPGGPVLAVVLSLCRSDESAPDQISRIEWVTLRLELFWQFHLAQQRGKLLLQNQDTDGLDELLAAFGSQRLMSGVAQFLLVMLDRDAAKIATLRMKLMFVVYIMYITH